MRINGMRRLFLIVALAAASSLSGQLRRAVTPGAPAHRVVIPFRYGLESVTTGVPNEAWFSLVTIHNSGTDTLNYSSYVPCFFDPCTPRLAGSDIAPGESQALFTGNIYVNRGDATFSLRVDDVTSRPGYQQSYSPTGIEVPVMRDGDFQRVIVLENVPAATPWNAFLYVFSRDTANTAATVEILDSGTTGPPLESFPLPLSPAVLLEGVTIFPPAASVDIIDHLRKFSGLNPAHDVALRIESAAPVFAFVVLHDSVAHKLGIVTPPH